MFVMHHHVCEGASPDDRSDPRPRRRAPGRAPSRTPHIGPLGRVARFTYRRRGLTVLAWVAALGVAIAARGELRRRVQGRLLGARVRLPAGADPPRGPLPEPGRRHRRRRRPRRRRCRGPGRPAADHRPARPDAAGAARRRRERPVLRPGRRQPATARRWSPTCASTSRTPSTCRRRTASSSSTSPTAPPRTGFQVGARRAVHPAGRAGCHRLRGHRPRWRPRSSCW